MLRLDLELKPMTPHLVKLPVADTLSEANLFLTRRLSNLESAIRISLRRLLREMRRMIVNFWGQKKTVVGCD